MSVSNSSSFLRIVLWADAIVSFATGLLQVAANAPLADLTRLPAGLLGWTGEFYLVYGLFVGWLASRKSPPGMAVWLVVIGNAAWALATLVVLYGGSLAPTALGQAFVLVQALAVGALAGLQFMALRARSGSAAAV